MVTNGVIAAGDEASMEPRSVERGKEVEFDMPCEKCKELQWSRARLSAERIFSTDPCHLSALRFNGAALG